MLLKHLASTMVNMVGQKLGQVLLCSSMSFGIETYNTDMLQSCKRGFLNLSRHCLIQQLLQVSLVGAMRGMRLGQGLVVKHGVRVVHVRAVDMCFLRHQI